MWNSHRIKKNGRQKPGRFRKIIPDQEGKLQIVGLVTYSRTLRAIGQK